MSSYEQLQEKILHLTYEKNQLERFKYLNELILSGLNAILSSDKHDEIFQKLFAVIHEVINCQHIVVLSQNADLQQLELIRSTNALMSCHPIPQIALTDIMQGTHNFFNVNKLPWWPQYFQGAFSDSNAMLTHAFSTSQSHYILMLMAKPIGHFSPQLQEILHHFTSFVANTLTQVETRKLIQERDQLLQRQKRIEASLLQQEKMASLGQLAAGVAHELNNPLGFIYSNLNTLNVYLQDLSSVFAKHNDLLSDTGRASAIDVNFLLSDGLELITESLEGARRARDIINNLRAYSHPDEKKITLLSPDVLVENAVKIVRTQIKYNAQVITKYEPELPAIMGNSNQLNQVLINLITNANQAVTAGKGQITINCFRANQHVCIDIADNGCGIPESIQHRIFEPFFTTKDVGQGTGLGLSLCKAIVEQHSGEIELLKSDASGTTFRLHFPVAV